MTTVYIDSEILKKAKEAGINISQFLEAQLRLQLQNNKRRMAGPPGFEPGISGLEGRRAFWIKTYRLYCPSCATDPPPIF